MKRPERQSSLLTPQIIMQPNGGVVEQKSEGFGSRLSLTQTYLIGPLGLARTLVFRIREGRAHKTLSAIDVTRNGRTFVHYVVSEDATLVKVHNPYEPLGRSLIGIICYRKDIPPQIKFALRPEQNVILSGERTQAEDVHTIQTKLERMLQNLHAVEQATLLRNETFTNVPEQLADSIRLADRKQRMEEFINEYIFPDDSDKAKRAIELLDALQIPLKIFERPDISVATAEGFTKDIARLIANNLVAFETKLFPNHTLVCNLLPGGIDYISVERGILDDSPLDFPAFMAQKVLFGDRIFIDDGFFVITPSNDGFVIKLFKQIDGRDVPQRVVTIKNADGKDITPIACGIRADFRHVTDEIAPVDLAYPLDPSKDLTTRTAK